MKFTQIAIGLVLIGSALMTQAAQTAEQIAASKQAAQAAGLDLSTSISSGAKSPSTLVNQGGATGSDNVWGTSYTGTADSTLTDKATNPSLIGIGNSAKNASVSGFTSYNNNRADQANQSNYFIARNPIDKPPLTQTDPLAVAAYSSVNDPGFNSSTNKNCQQQTVTETRDNSTLYTCLESYIPYTISCSTLSDVSFVSVPGPDIAATIDSYSCPASSGTTVTTLNGTNCTSTTTSTNSATTNYTCPNGGTVSGVNCVLRELTTPTAGTATVSCPPGEVLTDPGATNYSCAAGETKNGVSCSKVTTNTTPATVNYSCSTGQVLSGTNCVTSTTSSATPVYSCASGVFNGSVCVTTGSYAATATQPCASFKGYHWDYGGPAPDVMDFCTASFLGCSGLNTTDTNNNLQRICVPASGCPVGTSQKNNWSPYYRNAWGQSPSCAITSSIFTCPDGSAPSGSTCTSSSVSSPTISYSCPGGSVLSGATCTSTTNAPATIAYSCVVGVMDANGISCTESITNTHLATSSTTPGTCVKTTTTITDPSVLTTDTATGTCAANQVLTPASTNYTCPTGTSLSGSQCIQPPGKTSAAAINYSCNAGDTLNGVSCAHTTTNTTPATANYSCSTGQILSGTTCVASTTQSAVTNYYCGSGTLSGGSCVTNTSYQATGSYSANCANVNKSYYDNSLQRCILTIGNGVSGEAGLGYVGVCNDFFPAYAGSFDGAATMYTLSVVYCAYFPPTVYFCPAGGTLSGTTCSASSTTTASVYYSCPSGGTLSGTTCTSTTNAPATIAYTCAVGVLAANGTTCVQSTTTTRPADVYYSCPSNADLSGSTCTTNAQVITNATATAVSATCTATFCSPDKTTIPSVTTYTCPAGKQVSGSNCLEVVPTSSAAAINYSCNAGDTLNGVSCAKTTTNTYPGIVNYSCPANAVLSGAVCNSSATVTTNATGTTTPMMCSKTTTSSTAAYPSYSCPSGGTLAGSVCNVTTASTTIATVSYSCPADATKTGTSCTSTSVTTAAASPSYACPTGFTKNGDRCTGASTDSLVQAASSGCGPLEGLTN
jgi:hypothetical protein